ncbi:hypothetical protein F5883DRAFT_15821 [Diaporthe sp. PMI_573]|nr:hypothetical protein F5883DRAFT_15821 [Diaporthaceae sp. PMI_573]
MPKQLKGICSIAPRPIFILQHKAITLLQRVQAIAQEELDRVVGVDRLPSWDDRLSLQYVRGVVEGTLTCAPTTISGGVPHATKEDNKYHDKLIRKGTMGMMSVVSQDSTKRLHFTFGIGRRVCLGFHGGERNLTHPMDV